MDDWDHFIHGWNTDGHAEITLGTWTGVTRFSDVDREYEAARKRAGLHDRSYRGLLEIVGRDRVEWLNNLTTNDVKALQTGRGQYAFAVNIKGRILFDMNILARPESIWVDIDRRWVAAAQAHFAKYTVVEDVTVSDRSQDFVRLALTGSEIPDVLAGFGVPRVGDFAPLQLGQLNEGGGEAEFFRHDLGGGVGIELFVTADRAQSVWRSLVDTDAITPVGYDVLNTLRIESGIPWPIAEITDTVLPFETNQFERAVNIHKGCYLGQEVVERMRSRGSVARKLALLRFDDDRLPTTGANVVCGDERSGRITSTCRSQAYRAPLALAYVRAPHAAVGTRLVVEHDDERIGCTVIEPPATA